MENLVIQAKKKITLDKFVSSVKISASGEIKNILDVSARAVISSVEQTNNILTLAGKVFVTAIYLGEDNKILSAESVAEFSNKQQVLTALSNIVARDNVSVEIEAISGAEALCSVTHNTHIFGIYGYEVPDFVGANTAFVLNKKAFESLEFVGSGEDNFVVAEEVESNLKNIQILSSKAKIVSKEVSVAVDKVVVNGKILVESIYTDEDSTSVIAKEFEFKQEIALGGALPNMMAEAFVDVKNVTITPEDKQGKTNIVYAVDLYAKCYAYDKNTYEIAADMFALDSEIQNTYDYLEIKNYSSEKEFYDVVMSSTNVAEILDFDDIVGVYSPEVKILNVSQDNTMAYVDGEIVAFALYKSKESIKRLEISSSVKFEISKEDLENVEDSKIEAEISSFKVKAGKELEVAFKVSGVMSFSTPVSQSYVKSYEIKEEKPLNEGGIKVYITRQGETLFDVAKVLSVRPEDIAEQNEVDDVFEQGEKIYVYSPINLM